VVMQSGDAIIAPGMQKVLAELEPSRPTFEMADFGIIGIELRNLGLDLPIALWLSR
jgi:hypothetical protein